MVGQEIKVEEMGLRLQAEEMALRARQIDEEYLVT